ncbi:motility associated factor glycosyltransferase family protein [Motiliproteus sediminis]|uniref:motility associated factor glycosyltransferase family protein n=1 Tax=Motiliproteus sediminis TaxID=1468178 RepID=UPI001AEF56BF|nr:6-hydroxymethylpterin diphosphokinase MptE-like protein [Motiliproteus sediminis]
MAEPQTAQQRVQEINQRFNQNLAFFKEFAPAIYERYANYHPTQTQLQYVPEEDALHLVDIASQGRIYPSPPEAFCRQSVDDFLASPQLMTVNVDRISETLWGENTHIYQTNRIIDLVHQAQQQQRRPLRTREPFVLMQGLGLGYQVPALLEKLEIQYLCIIEPSEDHFYASFAAIDWRAIYQYFGEQGRDLCLIVGESTEETLRHVKQFCQGIGFYNTASPLVFPHLDSEQIRERMARIAEDMRINLGRLGFFEDEGISLAHTYNNLKDGVPIFHPKPEILRKLQKVPVIVAANGPSLDSAREFLLANQDKALICSCGTAFESLVSMGVKPDLHFESERLKSTSEWLEKLTTESQRRGVAILALNTVHSETFAKFPRKGMFFKPQDMGSSYYLHHLRDADEIMYLPNYSNPTVGNAGISFTTLMGFQNIYLVGLDLGFGEDDAHHAGAGKLFDPQGANFQQHFSQLTQAADDNAIVVDGNFRPQVRTTSAWITSKIYAERLIAASPNHRYYNLSDGVRIEGAKTTRFSEAKLKKKLDKDTLVKKLLQNFSPLPPGRTPKPETLLAQLNDSRILLEGLIGLFSKEPASYTGALDQLADQQALLNSLDQQDINYLMLHGSVEYFSLLLMMLLQHSETEVQGLENYRAGVSLYRPFLEHSLANISLDLLEPDDRIRGIELAPGADS